VIGGGPAGLRAAEVAAAAGVTVALFDAKPSVGRKFLIAGKGGLNLTHGEEMERFIRRYSGPEQTDGVWKSLLEGFDPMALRDWAGGLGVETFQASSGRVYPKAMKAAPLLRRWIERLRSYGVGFHMNHRWIDLVPGSPHTLGFSNGESVHADAVVFALGGGSWPQTGSDGSWVEKFRKLGIECRGLMPANCGWRHSWSAEVLAMAEGKPIKNIVAHAGDVVASGELLLTRYGLEGGVIYQLGRALREMQSPAITIDFKPTFSHQQLVAKMESVRRGFVDEARVRWRLGDAAHAILSRRVWDDVDALVREVKHCVIPLDGPQPLAEAISSAGGVCWSEVDAGLMLRRFPGVFVAGEMIDWEAPTGGYLMQGCFATGHRAGTAAVNGLKNPS
jgi:uncharacterized flavoprotein (TIGR03862 family)